MSNQFISPNWHILLIHYPLAFLSGGILIEIFSFFWPRGFFRAAGRWMILLGALLSIPALAAGLYAFRAVVTPSGSEIHMMAWYKVIQESPWSKQQWDFMRYHVRLNCIGTALVVVGVAVWIAASDLWRRRLYFPVLLMLICGMGAFGAGSWFGGESVYRLGTALEPTDNVYAGFDTASHDIKWYAPPMELHIVLGGFMVTLSIAALALTIRRLEHPEVIPEPAELAGPGETAIEEDAKVHSSIPLRAVEPPDSEHHIPDEPLDPEGSGGLAFASSPGTPPGAVAAPLTASPRGAQHSISTPYTTATATATAAGPYPPAIIHAGRFWMLTFLAVLATAGAGLWSVVDVFSSERLNKNWQSLLHPEHGFRLPIHALLAAILVLLPLVLALLARYGRRRRGASITFIVIIVLVIAMQFWLGIAMFYDGHSGALYRFNPPVEVPM